MSDRDARITFDPSTETMDVDIRIVAATNKNLQEAVSKGEFREDLFYRLSVVRIVLPPLRDRKDDVPLFIRHFFKKYSRAFEKNIGGISLAQS